MAAQDQGPSFLRLARPIVVYGFHFPAGSTECGPASLPYLHSWACQTIDGGDANNDEAGAVALVLFPNGLANIGYSEDDSYHHITRLNSVYQRLFTFVPYSRK